MLHKSDSKHRVYNIGNEKRGKERKDQRNREVVHEFTYNTRPEDKREKRRKSC